MKAEAEKLTQAAQYECNETRPDYRSDHYSRNLTTASGAVTLKVPKLKGISVEAAIIERYCRWEAWKRLSSRCPGRRICLVCGDITEVLWGSKVSPATISELRISTLRIGGTIPGKVDGIRMFMGIEFTCAVTGAEV